MDRPLPLPTLLSHAFVAFVIEFDNEAERRLPHSTTLLGRSAPTLPAPWLISWGMYATGLRFLNDRGLTERQLERLARTPTNLNGLQRWGYVLVTPDPADKRAKPPRSSWLITPTMGGRRTQEIWAPLTAEIEKRWEWRFGTKIERLREVLLAVTSKLDPALPTCMPILGFGLISKGRVTELPVDPDAPPSDTSLPALLAKVLLAFALEFESESALSLAICANILRVLQAGVRMRDLPELSGVSNESVQMALGILRKSRLAIEEKAPKSEGPWKIVRLTEAGLAAKEAYERTLSKIESGWEKRFGSATIRALREPLEELAWTGELAHAPLGEGLEPPPGGWRSLIEKPRTLPHFPMVLHRGGYPDGS